MWIPMWHEDLISLAVEQLVNQIPLEPFLAISSSSSSSSSSSASSTEGSAVKSVSSFQSNMESIQPPIVHSEGVQSPPISSSSNHFPTNLVLRQQQQESQQEGPSVLLSPAIVTKTTTMTSPQQQTIQSPTTSTSTTVISPIPLSTAAGDGLVSSPSTGLLKAWEMMHTDKLLQNKQGLEAYLDDEGIISEEYLEYCQWEQWNSISQFFKSIPQRRFSDLFPQEKK
jgi:hypothetical protein